MLKQRYYWNYWSAKRGQIGIVVLLLTVVLLTIGLSIASRSITDVRLSRQEEESSRAFNAAEAGIEEALRKNLSSIVASGSCGVGCGTGSVMLGGITANYKVTEENTLETQIDEGETVEVNVTGLGNGNSLNIDWAKTACPSAASIVVAIYNGNSKTVRRTPYQGCPHGDSFAVSSPGSGGFQFHKVVDLTNSDQYIRIRAVYTGTQLRVTGAGGTVLPVQFWRIRSDARTTGGETRSVEVTQTPPAPPSIFDFVIFSGSGLTK